MRPGIACARTGVASRSADERPVALRVAAFTGTEGNPRYSAQGVLHGQGIGVLEDLLRDTVTERGVSSGGAVYFGEAFSTLYSVLARSQHGR